MSSIRGRREQELGLRDVHVARVDLAEAQVLGTRLARSGTSTGRTPEAVSSGASNAPARSMSSTRLLAREVELELDLAAVATPRLATSPRPRASAVTSDAKPSPRRAATARAEAERVDGVAEQHHGDGCSCLDQGLQRSVVDVGLEVLGRVLHRQELVDTRRAQRLGVPAGALADHGHGDAAAGLVLQPEPRADQLERDLAQLSLPRLSAITRTPLIRSSSP